jgi:two-component system, chemotaxis family, response regulator PixG
MQNSQQIFYSNLLKEFQDCTQIKFNGRLEFQSQKGHKWNFYYRLGRIIWATGGINPSRRWRRQMGKYCPEINIQQLELQQTDLVSDYWDYILLSKLCQKAELINIITQKIMGEVSFDLAQKAHFIPVTWKRSSEVSLDLLSSFTNTNFSLQSMDNEWRKWSSTGFANISPGSALIIAQPEELQKLVTPGVYNNFVKLINGKNTLWDLATNLNQDIANLTSSLRNYILKGLMKFVQVADLPLVATKPNNSPSSTKPQQQKSPLIVCIDDSPQVCQLLNHIITSCGMRAITIQNPIEALPILIEQKPDLILLDLIMPVINGYELCSQIRRASGFDKIPVIILTGSNSPHDKAQSQKFGATDFISKPVEPEKVVAAIRKYLLNHLSASSASK